MITFQQTGFIQAPVEKVFAYVADFSRIPKWRPDVPAISGISGPPQSGTTFQEEVHFMGKKQLLMKVTSFTPNEKIVIEALEGMSLLPTQSFVFKQEGNRTRIDLTVNMKTSGLFRLMQPMLKGKLTKTWAQYFVNLDEEIRKL